MTNDKKYQGELMPVQRGNGITQMIYVYENSSDFPNYDIVVMGAGGNSEKSFEAERIPINEELWRRIGHALGYRFVIRNRQNKNSESKIPPTEA